MLKKYAVIATLLVVSPTFANTKKSLSWQVKNKTWTRSFEKSYEDFIASLGKAKKAGLCHTTDQCLKSKEANPKYYNLNPSNLRDVFSDCADLPYILRGYFAWMNDLPFSYPNALHPATWYTPEKDAIRAQIKELEKEMYNAGFFKKRSIKAKIKDLRQALNDGKKKVPDLRYNTLGNVVISKRYVQNGDSVNEVLSSISGSISTASFRTNASKFEDGKNFRDTYPVEISRDAIKPGTVLYDPNGHIAVVYEVTSNGKIHLIDAHPDNSLTAITYGEKFSRTDVRIGGGFANWRSFSVANDTVETVENKELSDYSLEQFQKSDTYNFNDRPMSFYEYVRNKLSKGNLVYEPVAEFSELLDEICYDVKERNLAVNASLKAGLQNQSHPDTLPENIYGTEGDWETYSSPSRDARLKASVREGKELVLKMIEGHRNGDANIQYNGVDLLSDLERVYKKKTASCAFDIKGSAGNDISLNLDMVLENLFKLSFDPYHCVELRWGLTDSTSINNCGQNREKLDWYNAQQGLRNRIDRDYSMKMDYSLRELPSAPISKVAQEDLGLKEIFN
ncbi:hypothetical protein M899_2572 [Bacteriovorax sp. BSW11_IV]|uniref:hypothetical protein n=1 Tax=Bacteriovorax sp. BSW11_IV TaxID=1353529 RepID=UPI000389EEEA|nr:hypothetical protein [Bacteriovorax sp. BSW11_IV]EQC50358.1 hypothetical protein M899_2572 [Bacteriovorax sp. BSW11_IV]